MNFIAQTRLSNTLEVIYFILAAYASFQKATMMLGVITRLFNSLLTKYQFTHSIEYIFIKC